MRILLVLFSIFLVSCNEKPTSQVDVWQLWWDGLSDHQKHVAIGQALGIEEAYEYGIIEFP